jgi:cell wall-associated NlpC family hydrolase
MTAPIPQKPTRSAIVARARAAIGKGTAYKLGAGGRLKNPGVGSELDCSGFVAVVLGVDRYLEPWLPHYEGGDWLETSALVRDAQSPWGFVAHQLWADAKPGDLVVWGDRGHGQGHVGIVATVDSAGPKTVVHCSAGNYRTSGDAIRETSASLFQRNGAIVARVAWVEDEFSGEAA